MTRFSSMPPAMSEASSGLLAYPFLIEPNFDLLEQADDSDGDICS